MKSKSKNQKTYINISNFDFLKVLALLLVILRHSLAPFVGAWNLEEFQYQHNDTIVLFGHYISTISMPLYVFISGLLFSYLRNQLGKYSSFKILWYKKIKRLIRPYTFLAPLYIYFFIDYSSYSEFLQSFIQGAGHLWFLLMIFIVFMMFYPLENYFKKRPWEGFIISCFLYLMAPILQIIGVNTVSMAFKYLPFFYIGYFFFYEGTCILKFLKNKQIFIFFAHSILFAFVYSLPDYIDNSKVLTALQVILFLPMSILSISFIFYNLNNLKIKEYPLMVKFVRNTNEMSYYIYLLHQPLLILFFTKLEFLPRWSFLQIIITGFLSVFLVSLMLSNILMKFSLGKKLIGAK